MAFIWDSNTTIVSINRRKIIINMEAIKNSNTTIVSINPIPAITNPIGLAFKYNYCFY